MAKLARVGDLPLIISVDDHVVEPADVWQDRLPAKYRDVGPRIVRAPMGEITFVGGKLTVVPGTEGVPTDWWYYEELRRPLLRLDAAVGVPRDEVTITGVTYDDMRPGAAEVRRNAARGVKAVCFSEIPPFLGLPSVHDPDNYWDPFFEACAETGTVINMHIGSPAKNHSH